MGKLVFGFVVWAAITALVSGAIAAVLWFVGTVTASAQGWAYCGPSCWEPISRGLAALLWAVCSSAGALWAFAIAVGNGE